MSWQLLNSLPWNLVQDESYDFGNLLTLALQSGQSCDLSDTLDYGQIPVESMASASAIFYV